MSDAALTNLGPLPTDFAIAPSCSKSLDDVYKVFTSFDGWYFLIQGPVEQTSCYPSGYSANSKQYYSPARCPTGFTSACQSSNVAGTVSETVVRCCPTHESFVCQSTVSYGWEATLGCVNLQDTSTTTVWTVSQVSSGETALTTYTNAIGGINAYQVQVGFQSTDFASSTSTTRTTKSSTQSQTQSQTQATAHTTIASPSDISGSNNNSSKTGRKHGNGVGGGAIAGIVIGAIAGLLIIAALIWLQIRKRRQRNEEAQQAEQAEQAQYPPPVPEKFNDIAPSQVIQDRAVYENPEPPHVVYEMAAPEPPAELDSGGARHPMNTYYPSSR
ncbi:hypothetical protein E0Z10_g7947 [Xylaria hypoxylon]|uniref:Mid2 domain-containing protein n=1 Tax=Xylaria hypoxylon TaxID=37992 RepID=A0A4Z0YA94_9PEZI|nr:hypothetical protein E0Z10_g7947 [Xylaria hypoxylon]